MVASTAGRIPGGKPVLSRTNAENWGGRRQSNSASLLQMIQRTIIKYLKIYFMVERCVHIYERQM